MSDPSVGRIEKNFHNASESYKMWPELKYTMEYTVVLAILYSIAFLLSLAGNILVILTVWKNSNMHTIINYFICNLSVADIMAAVFCIPITLLQNIFKSWIMGQVLCKLSPFLQGCAVSASVATFAVVSFDRCLAICFPLKRFFTKKIAKGMIVTIWIYSALMFCPWLLFYNVTTLPLRDPNNTDANQTGPNETEPNCFITWPHPQGLWDKLHFFIVSVFLCYILPLTLTSVCYVSIGFKVIRRTRQSDPRSRKPEDSHKPRDENTNFLRQSSGNSKEKSIKIVKMLVIVVVVFAAVWLPLLAIASADKLVELPMNVRHIVVHYLPLTQWIAYTNCFVNPWIYCIFSKNFRASFARLLCMRSTSTTSVVTRSVTTAKYNRDTPGKTVYKFSSATTTPNATMNGYKHEPGGALRLTTQSQVTHLAVLNPASGSPSFRRLEQEDRV